MVKESTFKEMKEYGSKSFKNSHILFESMYRDHPEDALKYKTVPFIELGKIYYFEERIINVTYKIVWIGIAVKLEPHSIGFKIIATNRESFYNGIIDCHDLFCTTLYCMTWTENLHEIDKEDFPLYINMGYVSPLLYTAMKEEFTT